VSDGREALAPAQSETARVEAFSDGVFAIAITLLILDVKVPREMVSSAALTRALHDAWPSFFAFLTSFAVIGIMWLNHHRLFTLIRRSDHTLIVLNLLLLLGVTFVPFPTALLAEYLGHPGERVAALFYNGTFVGLSIVFNGLWHYASQGRRLLGENCTPEMAEQQTRQYRYGPLMYAAALAVAFVSVGLSVALDLGLAVFFALPLRGSGPAPPARTSVAPR
jgi:uncharacterized membrane protein